MSLFASYYGAIRITDGMRPLWSDSDKIVCHNQDGTVLTIKTKKYKGHGRILWEYKGTKGNRLLEWKRFGAFYRVYAREGKKELQFHPDSLQTLHGITERTDQRLFGVKGTCRTKYSHGRFLSQEFRYANRKLGFKIHHSDKTASVKYSNGTLAGTIACSGKGFSARGGNPDRQYYSGGHDSDVHTCFEGAVYFETKKKGWALDNDGRGLDFSKDGNCSHVLYDRRGKVRAQGEYKNRQKVGAWIVKGTPVYFINGVAVAKKLWDTPPEKINVKKVLRLRNVQLRAALLARIGPERLVKKLKGKTIHQTKNGMRLVQLPVKMDDGTGAHKSFLRILQVTCPSTKNKYYLTVPDFVWDDGKKTKLDTCEQARQWTFGVNDPKKKIKFAVET